MIGVGSVARKVRAAKHRFPSASLRALCADDFVLLAGAPALRTIGDLATECGS